MSEPSINLTRYCPWFYAAALYNLIWGGLNVVAPFALFDLIGMPRPDPAPLWQVVGMFVLVYAPAYWWAARDPDRHRHLIAIALLGKLGGPLGYLWSAASGRLPWAFGLVILFNDLIWWPSFGLFLRDAARKHGGFIALLSGK